MNVAAQLDRPRRLWLRIEDFVLLAESGALDSYSKTELIDGEVVTMNARFRPLAYAQSQLYVRLVQALQALDPGHSALFEASIAMPPHDMPQPDITITSAPRGDGAIPLASVALIVEISSSTRTFDLGRKASLYARRGVPEYWVFDLQAAEIVRHWQPDAQGYGHREVTPVGGDLPAATIPGLTIATSGLS